MVIRQKEDGIIQILSPSSMKAIGAIVIGFIAFGIFVGIINAIISATNASGNALAILQILSLIGGLYVFYKAYSLINPSKGKHASFKLTK